MQLLVKFLSFITIFASTSLAAYRDWSYEVIDANCQSEDPDVLECKLETSLVGRDDYRVSGYIDAKVELTDELFTEVVVLKSASGSNDYKATPFRVSKKNLTTILNEYYKVLLMPSFKKCAPQAPQFQRFVPPFKPRFMEFNNCVVDESKFPTLMPYGYYKVMIILSGQARLTVNFAARVFNKLFRD